MNELKRHSLYFIMHYLISTFYCCIVVSQATLEATFFTTPPAFNSSFSPISNQSNVTQSKPVVPVMHSFTVVWSMDVPNARARFDYYMNDNTTSKVRT
jgi:hypothetical protein